VPPSVRPGDVYWLPIPGDNKQTKTRIAIVLEATPTRERPEAVVIIFGCSRTKSRAKDGRYFRVDEESPWFNTLGLSNATTFHLEDIRFYDASSSRLTRRRGRCPRKPFLELRKLWDIFLEEGVQGVPLLPAKPSAGAKQAVEAFRDQAEVPVTSTEATDTYDPR
jgi:hypothetical protein